MRFTLLAADETPTQETLVCPGLLGNRRLVQQGAPPLASGETAFEVDRFRADGLLGVKLCNTPVEALAWVINHTLAPGPQAGNQRGFRLETWRPHPVAPQGVPCWIYSVVHRLTGMAMLIEPVYEGEAGSLTAIANEGPNGRPLLQNVTEETPPEWTSTGRSVAVAGRPELCRVE